MNIVIVDLEFQKDLNNNLDIIQVGAVKVDLLRSNIEPLFNEFVNPYDGFVIDEDISSLTGITFADIVDARRSEAVERSFWEAVRNSQCGCRLASWGMDAEFLELRGIKNDLGIKSGEIEVYDLKKIFNLFRASRSITNKKGTSLIGTMTAYGLEFEGRQHNAYDDAYNTGRLLIEAISR